MASGNDRSVGYDEFGAWYDTYRPTVLEPALESATSSLADTLGDVLSDRDLTRIRSTTARVKSKRRAWRKLSQPRYSQRVADVGDIPEVIDDLVGLRLTCINVRDIDMVQAALEALPRRRSGPGSLWLDPTSERDYVVEPKDSGYRGWHVNLGTVISRAGEETPVTCELQVRTLLQDSWGELTHEDTYSKDGALPPLVEVLSKRMADLFSILDEIAEDLRTELDRLDEEAVTDVGPEPAEPAAPTELAADAAALLQARWEGIDRPTDLASLAWELQREFGAEISDGWFGRGSFKQFLRDAVPDGEVSTGRQAYLLPRDYSPDDADPAPVEDDSPPTAPTPGAVRQLRRIDRAYPLLDAEDWPLLYGHLAEAWRRLGPRPANTRLVNQLTRSARDQARATGRPVSRRHLDYVAKAVLTQDDSGQPLDADQIATAFTAVTIQRMTDLRILDPRHEKARKAVRQWLGSP